MVDGCAGLEANQALPGTSRSLLQPLYPLVAAAIEVRPLREQLLVVSACRLGESRFGEGVLKVLAGEAHHEGAAWSELPWAHQWPSAWRGGADDGHAQVSGIYVLLDLSRAVNAMVRLV